MCWRYPLRRVGRPTLGPAEVLAEEHLPVDLISAAMPP